MQPISLTQLFFKLLLLCTQDSKVVTGGVGWLKTHIQRSSHRILKAQCWLIIRNVKSCAKRMTTEQTFYQTRFKLCQPGMSPLGEERGHNQS